jgi:hypothetical protein
MLSLSEALHQIGDENSDGCSWCGALALTTSEDGSFKWFHPATECCVPRLQSLKSGRRLELASISKKMNSFDMPDEIPLDLIRLQDEVKAEMARINKLIGYIEKNPDYRQANLVDRPAPDIIVLKDDQSLEEEATEARKKLAEQAVKLLPTDEIVDIPDDILESMFSEGTNEDV